MGVDVSSDACSGEGWGAFVSTSAINPSNWTRSYSKSAYIDPLPPRTNLHILTNQTVTRMIFDNSAGTLKATAVEYANNGYQQKPWPTVGVNKEVIVAGGPVGSPNILMQSGVGPADKLQAAGVQVGESFYFLSWYPCRTHIDAKTQRTPCLASVNTPKTIWYVLSFWHVFPLARLTVIPQSTQVVFRTSAQTTAQLYASGAVR